MTAMVTAGRYAQRVAAADWDSVARELDEYGCAPLPQLLTPAECARIAGLYGDPGHFRATIDMARHRFGAGEYRYFAAPFPEPVDALRHALYPRLLPVARDWHTRLGRPAVWPDTLGEWLDICHAAGQTRPTPILLRYETGGWNALHRDLYGDKVFPLQVVVNLNDP
ncbi:MAG TPA: 2OG-Fe(II) oxygenase, partial [Streptosporangiaceae bacterium]